MPEMDGIEASRRIRELEGLNSRTPIIALTAYALQGDRERLLSMGMDEYISKRIQMDELFYVLEHVPAFKNELQNTGDIHSVGIDVNGDIVFITKTKGEIKKKKLPDINEILYRLNELETAVKYSDFSVIEAIAHRVKLLFDEMDADEIKSMAFKIELAARRENLAEIIECTIKIKHEFETYKKSQTGV